MRKYFLASMQKHTVNYKLVTMAHIVSGQQQQMTCDASQHRATNVVNSLLDIGEAIRAAVLLKFYGDNL